jgi:phenylalanyl-tRNA synthetase alpha chain
MEPDVSCGVCGGEGCRTCKYSGWLEMGGSGMVDPRVFENVGLDPEEWSGFAFGCGLERVAQLRHGIAEIRPLWSPDLRALGQFCEFRSPGSETTSRSTCRYRSSRTA